MSRVMQAGATGHWAGSLRMQLPRSLQELLLASAEVGPQLLQPHKPAGQQAMRRVLWALTGCPSHNRRATRDLW